MIFENIIIYFSRGVIILLSFAVIIFTVFFGVLSFAFLGPSESIRDRLTLSMLETSAAHVLPKIFLSEKKVDEIVESNRILEITEITDTSLINIAGTQNMSEDEWAVHPDGIRIVPISGATYRGHVMLIRDPSRVYAATSSDFRSNLPGMKIEDVLRREGAVAGINGGGFPDDGTLNVTGDVPIGLTFSKGKHMWGDINTVYTSVMAFDTNDVLIVGNMSPTQAQERGIRDAMCFGPILVVNGEPAQIRGTGGGLNPRTAIGQRADGTVIFLVVDGRIPSSLGASYLDLIEIMLEFGAVNAGNLDGGSSSAMMYQGKVLNTPSTLYGTRRIPTYFMVKDL